MADAWTALIAGITGVAGLGGALVAGRFNMTIAARNHRKDDLASLRDKFEQLYSELDRVQNLSNLASVRAVSALEKKGLSEQAEAIDLGKVRAIIRLYFPTCQPLVDARDQRDVEDVKMLRDGVANDPLKAMCTYILAQTAGISKMCNDIRACLAAQAEEIGRSVRDSLAVPVENRASLDMARGGKRLAIACLVPYFGYWAITGWLAYAALPDYLARSDEAGRQNHWTTSAIWMQAANEADKQVQRSLAWGIALPIALVVVAGIIYWVSCGFRSKAGRRG